MDTTSYLALSRQVALQRHMTTIATNLANSSTTAYRAEHTLFEQEVIGPRCFNSVGKSVTYVNTARLHASQIRCREAHGKPHTAFPGP